MNVGSPIETARYDLSFSLSKERGKSEWKLTDKIFHLQFSWTDKQFKETYEFLPLPDYDKKNDPHLDDLILRAKQWLEYYHREKIFAAPLSF